MNIRQISFLNMLVSHSGEFLPIDRFAEDLQVSQKTLRRDLDLIETYLKDFGAGIERRSGVGDQALDPAGHKGSAAQPDLLSHLRQPQFGT